MRITPKETNQFSSFKARHIACAKALLPKSELNYKIYEITSKDSNFLNILLNSLNIQELLTNLTDKDYCLWQRVLNKVLNIYTSKNTKVLLLTKDQKPCGAMSYLDKGKSYEIIGRTTWPIKPNEKLPLAGKALTLYLFNNALEKTVNSIKSKVLRNTSFNSVTKSYELGFKSIGGCDYEEWMSINQDSMRKTIKKFKKNINIEKVDSTSDTNLSL